MTSVDQEIFKAGGVWQGVYYPKLKPIFAAVPSAVEAEFCSYFQYEPGNGTRYDVLFSTYNDGYGSKTVMTLVNMRKAMIISNEMSLVNIGYMQEKLDLGEGDCYALIPLINHYLEELGS